ncbi:hypothetical protein PCANC_04703 [Puccinia coronata f. sp. avenae]|uniref:Uncharacterized protein n=1 Tax=Puccinia coronata f. sp. avenae TaxID=200324 RepID=A0A2N5W1T0_9BASI|nr:hypothetical protein PCANC_04703 [Puccinia coronata f. sp. avenae]
MAWELQLGSSCNTTTENPKQMSAPREFVPAADATNHVTTTNEQTASASHPSPSGFLCLDFSTTLQKETQSQKKNVRPAQPCVCRRCNPTATSD